MKLPPLTFGEAERALQFEETRPLLTVAVVGPEIEYASASGIGILVEDENCNLSCAVNDIAA
jgi:hypothetical protein